MDTRSCRKIGTPYITLNATRTKRCIRKCIGKIENALYVQDYSMKSEIQFEILRFMKQLVVIIYSFPNTTVYISTLGRWSRIRN